MCFWLKLCKGLLFAPSIFVFITGWLHPFNSIYWAPSVCCSLFAFACSRQFSQPALSWWWDRPALTLPYTLSLDHAQDWCFSSHGTARLTVTGKGVFKAEGRKLRHHGHLRVTGEHWEKTLGTCLSEMKKTKPLRDTGRGAPPLPLFFGLLNGDNDTVFTYLRETLSALFKGSSHESCCVITKNSYDKET